MKITILCPLYLGTGVRVFMAVPAEQAEKMRAGMVAHRIDSAGFCSTEVEAPGEIKDPQDLQSLLYRTEARFGLAFNRELGNDEAVALEWDEERGSFRDVRASINEAQEQALQEAYPWVGQFLVSLEAKAKDAVEFWKQC